VPALDSRLGPCPALGCPEVCTVRQAVCSASRSASRQASRRLRSCRRRLDGRDLMVQASNIPPALILWFRGVVEQPKLTTLKFDPCQVRGGILEDATKPISSTSSITPGQAKARVVNSAVCGPLVHPLGPSWEQRRAMALPGPRPAHHVGWSRHRPASGNSRDPGRMYSMERLLPGFRPLYITDQVFEHCIP